MGGKRWSQKPAQRQWPRAGPLHGDAGKEHVVANSAEAVASQEGHEEAKAHQDHDVNICMHAAMGGHVDGDACARASSLGMPTCEEAVVGGQAAVLGAAGLGVGIEEAARRQAAVGLVRNGGAQHRDRAAGTEVVVVPAPPR